MSKVFTTVIIPVFLSLLSICSAANFASQKPNLTRYLRENNLQEYGKLMEKKIERYLFAMDTPMKKDDAKDAHYAIDLYRFSQLMIKANDKKFFATFRWIEAKPKFLSQLVRNISEEDDFEKVMEILYELIRYELKDKRLSESKYALIIAVALVWDQPREPLHDKIPERDPEYVEMQPLEVYKHFVTLHRYLKLKKYRVSDLIYCVDTPVLIDDIQWVTRVAKMSTQTSWKNFNFKLDDERKTLNKIEWPTQNGDYSLRNISEKGGLIPDISYAKTMSGRIHGLPVAFFTSYNELEKSCFPVYLNTSFKTEKLDQNISEYIGSSYTVSPQTGLKVDDYVFEFMHSDISMSKSYDWADAQFRCAELLCELNDRNKRIPYFIWPAIKECSLHLKTWDLKERLLDTHYVKDESKIEYEIEKGEIYKFYQNKMKAFRKYPDIVYEAKEAYLARLNELENDRLARRYLRDFMKDCLKERVDIFVDLAISELNYRVSTEEISDGFYGEINLGYSFSFITSLSCD